MHIKRSLAVLGAVAAFAAVPASAFAATVYDGSDKAYNSGETLYTCDGEQDGNSVYSDYTGSSNGTAITRGGSGTCVRTSPGDLRSFNVCEQIPAFPDSCSSRVYV